MDSLKAIEAELVEAGKKLETIRGAEVEGLVRPTTDRAKFEKLLEVLAAIIAALRGVLASQGVTIDLDQTSDGASS